MKQWNLKLSNETEAGYFITLEANMGTAQQATVTISGSYESVIARYIGCVAVSFLPERGLADALQGLRIAWQFYNEEQPSPTNQALTQKTTPKVIGTVSRPKLALSR